MAKTHTTVQVGAPDPEARTSPIFDRSPEQYMSPDLELEEGCCFFNNAQFALGDYVCSGDGLLRCEGRGVWVREGVCPP